jgi:hypothetical protein
MVTMENPDTCTKETATGATAPTATEKPNTLSSTAIKPGKSMDMVCSVPPGSRPKPKNSGDAAKEK